MKNVAPVLARHMGEITDLSMRFTRDKTMDGKWHLMEMAYAKGYPSMGQYFLSTIKMIVAKEPQHIPWLQKKLRELDMDDFSGPIPGDDR